MNIALRKGHSASIANFGDAKGPCHTLAEHVPHKATIEACTGLSSDSLRKVQLSVGLYGNPATNPKKLKTEGAGGFAGNRQEQVWGRPNLNLASVRLLLSSTNCASRAWRGSLDSSLGPIWGAQNILFLDPQASTQNVGAITPSLREFWRVQVSSDPEIPFHIPPFAFFAP